MLEFRLCGQKAFVLFLPRFAKSLQMFWIHDDPHRNFAREWDAPSPALSIPVYMDISLRNQLNVFPVGKQSEIPSMAFGR
jgi:hypothetical protein